ncbi:hypothetical protein BpHYR1_017273 [Brachionus plicatilis]|uniref:Uncharacterized protein n=1 Tax=Brachionus plicatilis TaxID=10195 RepID=A0A3M7RAA0_BRAPC|nr:hypothetical protein BpHYR1_017273 [Brachionus plicatilis]
MRNFLLLFALLLTGFGLGRAFFYNENDESKKHPDIFTIDKEGNTIKYGLKNAEVKQEFREFEHYVDSTGETHATLVKNNLNSTDTFRLIAKLGSKNEPNVTYEIYPVKISNRRKRNAVKTNEFYHAFQKRNSNDQINTHAYINPLDARDYIVEKTSKQESKMDRLFTMLKH